MPMKVTRLPGTASAAPAASTAASGAGEVFASVLGERTHPPAAAVEAARPTGASVVERAIAAARAPDARGATAGRAKEEQEIAEAVIGNVLRSSRVSGAGSIDRASYDDGDEE